ncbi:MAG: hypothetical protein WCK98_06765 [bacterium]
MSLKQSYLNTVNAITKHSVFATLIMLIALGGVGASAAQLIAPDQYKPSKLWEKNSNKEKIVVSNSSSSSVSSTSSSANSSLARSSELDSAGFLNNDEFIVQGGGQMRYNDDASGGSELKRVSDGKIFAIMGSVFRPSVSTLDTNQKIKITGRFVEITKDTNFAGGSGNAKYLIINLSNLTVDGPTQITLAPKNDQGMSKVVSSKCDPAIYSIDIPSGIISYSKNIGEPNNPTGAALLDNVSMTITSKKLNLSDWKKTNLIYLQNYLDTGKAITEEKDKIDYSFNQYCTIGGTGRVEFSNKKIAYPGTDIARLSVAGYGQELPGDLVVEIYAKKGDDFIMLRKPLASMFEANTDYSTENAKITDYTKTNYGNCQTNPNCVQDYVKNTPSLQTKIDKAVQNLLATFAF